MARDSFTNNWMNASRGQTARNLQRIDGIGFDYILFFKSHKRQLSKRQKFYEDRRVMGILITSLIVQYSRILILRCVPRMFSFSSERHEKRHNNSSAKSCQLYLFANQNTIDNPVVNFYNIHGAACASLIRRPVTRRHKHQQFLPSNFLVFF